MWYDDHKHTTNQDRIMDASNAYVRRFHRKPELVLIHPSLSLESVTLDGATVAHGSVGNPQTVWVGLRA